jgi:hypothetical protein
VFHRESVLTQDEYDTWLNKFNPVIVYCRPPNNVILSQEVRAKLHKPESHVEKVKLNRMALIHAYALYMANLKDRTGVTIFHYDWTADPTAKDLNNWFDWRKICAA